MYCKQPDQTQICNNWQKACFIHQAKKCNCKRDMGMIMLLWTVGWLRIHHLEFFMNALNIKIYVCTTSTYFVFLMWPNLLYIIINFYFIYCHKRVLFFCLKSNYSNSVSKESFVLRYLYTMYLINTKPLVPNPIRPQF